MGQYVSFEASKILGKLSLLQKTQLKFTQRRALSTLGREMKSKYLPKEMQKNFKTGKDTVPYTLRSIRWSLPSENILVFSVNPDDSKGNPPSKYLYAPMVGGGQAYITRFTKYLQSQNYIGAGTYAYPITTSPLVPKNQYNNVSGYFYRKVEVGLAKAIKKQGVTSKTKTPKNAKFRSITKDVTNKISAGIYRVKDGVYAGNKIFDYTTRKPTIPRTFDYYQSIRKQAALRLPVIWRREIRNALAKR